jgi:uncharacterized membrane protein YkvA (DUF1232 family)
VGTHSENFSNDSFWAKITRFARHAGREILEKAFVLYYTLDDSETPYWARAIIISALGYFILPIDAIPDAVPVVGFSDDLAVLGAALATVIAHVKPETFQRARRRVQEIFDGFFGADPARA